jgi:hypothetical protein
MHLLDLRRRRRAGQKNWIKKNAEERLENEETEKLKLNT